MRQGSFLKNDYFHKPKKMVNRKKVLALGAFALVLVLLMVNFLNFQTGFVISDKESLESQGITGNQVVDRQGLTRSSERVTYDDGSTAIWAYSYSTPHYYINSNGEVLPIDMTPVEIDDKTIYEKGVVAVEFDNTDGSVVFTPDQAVGTGTESLKFNVNKITFDSEDVEVEAGVNVFPNPQRWGARQVVKVEEQISSFEVEYLIDVNGLEIVEKNNEFWVYNDEGEFRFRILAPLFLDENLTALTHEGINHELIDNLDGTYTYRKYSTESFNGSSMPETYYIDADTYYSTTADQDVYYSLGGEATEANWNIAHDSTNGTGINRQFNNQDTVNL